MTVKVVMAIIAAMMNEIIDQEARKGEAGREGGGVRAAMIKRIGRKPLTDINLQVGEIEKKGQVATNTPDVVDIVMTEVVGGEETGVGTETMGTVGEVVAGHDQDRG